MSTTETPTVVPHVQEDTCRHCDQQIKLDIENGDLYHVNPDPTLAGDIACDLDPDRDRRTIDGEAVAEHRQTFRIDEHQLMEPSPYGDSPGHWRCHHLGPALTVCVAGSRGSGRFSLYYVDKTGETVVETGGPKIPGPYLSAYGKSICLTADPARSSGAEHEQNKQLGLVINARIGDILEFAGGDRWKIQWHGQRGFADYHNLSFVRIES